MKQTTLRNAILATALASGLVLTSAAQAQQPAPQTTPNQDLNMQFLGEMMRSASSFHDLVKGMQLQQTFGARDLDANLPPAERERREMARTAAIMGAGAGAGAAIGSMSHSEKGLLIGALVGAGSGLVIDQILRHRGDEKDEKAAQHPVSGPPPQLQLRDRDGNGVDNRDKYDRERYNREPGR